jgi:hypothetical protein
MGIFDLHPFAPFCSTSEKSEGEGALSDDRKFRVHLLGIMKKAHKKARPKQERALHFFHADI